MVAFRIDTDIAIVGNGDLIQNASVVIEDNKIVYAGENEHAPSIEKTLQAQVLMPGMWDCHVHFSGVKIPSLELMVVSDPLVGVLNCVSDARDTLRSGFTSVRDLAGFGIQLNKAIRSNDIEGPTIYGAGRMLSMTAGHADIPGVQLDVYHHLQSVNKHISGELVDGVSECYVAVRKQIRSGAGVIKFSASGGIFPELEIEGYTRVDRPSHQQFSDEEQRVIVEEATRAELAVAAHCHGEKGIESAIKAGVTTVEHGTYLTEELADLMVEHDTIFVPTRYAYEKLIENSSKLGLKEKSVAKLHEICDLHANAVKFAIKKGVKIAAGTDITTSGNSGFDKPGENALELKYLVDLGMTPMDAIVAATGNGALSVGQKGVGKGLIKSGYEADLLLLKENPLNDIEILADINNISQIIKQGNFIL